MTRLSFILLIIIASCKSTPKTVTPSTDSSQEKREQYLNFLTNSDSLTVEYGIERARQDFGDGKYYLIEYGEFFIDTTLNKNLENIYKKYKVRIEFGGCEVSKVGVAYTKEMSTLLDREKGVTSKILSEEAWRRIYPEEMKADSTTHYLDSISPK